MKGIEKIIEERREQIEKHGISIGDDHYNNDEYQLRHAACFLLSYLREDILPDAILENHLPIGWDWDRWKKMCKKTYKERLVIAGALIAAEIDRVYFY